MAFIPYDSEQSATPQNKKSEGLLDLFVPRSKEFLGNLGTIGKETVGEVGDVFKGLTGTPEEKKQAGKSFVSRQKNVQQAKSNLGANQSSWLEPGLTGKTVDKAAGSAGEIAPFLFNLPEKTTVNVGNKFLSNVLTKASPYVKSGVGAGIVHGVTTPEAGGGERTGKALGEGVVGGITGLGTSAGQQLLSGIFGTAKGFGRAVLRRIIRPVTGEGPGWAQRETESVQTLLDNSSPFNVNPEGYDRDVQKVLAKTTGAIKDKLKLNPEKMSYDDISDLVTKAVKENVAGFDPILNKGDGSSLTSYMNRVLDKAERNPDNVGYSIGSLNLFEAKQKIGDLLGKRGGAYYKLEKGLPLTKEDEVGLVVYDTIKDLIDSKNPGISQMTEMEHRLYQAGEGLFREGHKAVRTPSPFALEKIPGLALLFQVLEGIEMTAGRGVYEAGKKGQSVVNSPAANKLIQALTTAETEGSANLK